jgi:hypothetical protein
MACPYFIPAEPHERELWPHRYRLSLGDGFAGRCGACLPDTCCDDETLRLHCNLGYAACAHLPANREFDAVRFLLQRGKGSSILRVQFACERAHQSAFSGELRYDQSSRIWLDPPDPRLQPLAEAAVRAWLERYVPR